MRTAAPALILALAVPAAALSQPASVPLDSAVVEACLAQTPPRETQTDCIGLAAKLCQTAPDGETTLGISACLMAEHDAWDEILNREYAETRAHFSQTRGLTDTLLAAQRAWIAFRDAECTLAYDRWDGGSMRTIASADCRMRQTARRALELRAMRQP
ncbi:hypothetical protein PARHAE_02380 [Paracoccus haematequi]|uniref:Lysozyme inhibitor LprI-like N-terminal domain-containing protein n=1 Tax=Paracoccus haematequi TaxID=2491866 RepID=A0A447IP00_9RHOB|nr:lysozyme inhibitor LprI family protein [Paracoccus haematequi]VDS09190.1 hypothetical protein PARHAE_02380 [Paracoccus haematequi]